MWKHITAHLVIFSSWFTSPLHHLPGKGHSVFCMNTAMPWLARCWMTRKFFKQNKIIIFASVKIECLDMGIIVDCFSIMTLPHCIFENHLFLISITLWVLWGQNLCPLNLYIPNIQHNVVNEQTLNERINDKPTFVACTGYHAGLRMPGSKCEELENHPHHILTVWPSACLPNSLSFVFFVWDVVHVVRIRG